MKTLLKFSCVVCASLWFGATPATAAMMYADHVTSISRGDISVGSLPGYYGWSISSNVTVGLTESQAKAAVLGAPDNALLSLPGQGYTDPWEWAYVEVGFASNFTPGDKLVITEYGYSGQAEKATVWLWGTDGSMVQTSIQRSGGSGNLNIVIDLTPWAGSFTSIARVGIGGLDAFGEAQGFDLNSIGVDVLTVPLPAALWLLVSGLIPLFGCTYRRKRAV